MFLFSLQAMQSNTYGGAFLQKKSQQQKVNQFCKKAPPQTFDWILNMALGDIFKKVIILKIFLKLCKTFCVYSYCAYFILLLKSEKKFYRKKQKTETLKPIY